jgi:hypothetical protein
LVSLRLFACGVLAVVGGLLMFLGGVTAHSLALWILPMLRQQVLTKLPPTVQAASSMVIDVIAALVSLGGITVAIGGVILIFGRRTTGRLLIALGGGAGLLGLAGALGYTLIVSGPASIGDHVGYWVGLVMAVAARRFA